MNSLKFKFLSFIILITVIFITAGCKKNPIFPETANIELLNTDNYPDIPDEEFYGAISGFITISNDVQLSNKSKAILLEQIEGSNHDLLIKKGFHLAYTKEDILLLENEGQTVKEEELKIQEQLGISSSLPMEEQLKIFEEGLKVENRAPVNPGTWNITYVPHYYEWDPTENPNHYNWCGHAVLKGVAKKHGQYKTLGQIHTIFCNNSPSGYCSGNRCSNDPGSYCANLADLLWSTNASGYKWYNYKFPASSMEKINSLSNFYQRLRDGVDYNKPAIVPSKYVYSYGHFYSVVGYKTQYKSNGDIDYYKSKVYLRDVADQTPNVFYEKSTSVKNFYNKMDGNQILFIRPN